MLLFFVEIHTRCWTLFRIGATQNLGFGGERGGGETHNLLSQQVLNITLTKCANAGLITLSRSKVKRESDFWDKLYMNQRSIRMLDSVTNKHLQ